MLRSIAIGGIRFYQKHLSKRKGFKCAYGVLHQNGTCSSRILTIVRTESIFNWYSLIRNQFSSCKSAFLTIENERNKRKDKKCNSNCSNCSGNLDCFSSCNTRGLNKCDDCGDCGDIGSC